MSIDYQALRVLRSISAIIKLHKTRDRGKTQDQAARVPHEHLYPKTAPGVLIETPTPELGSSQSSGLAEATPSRSFGKPGLPGAYTDRSRIPTIATRRHTPISEAYIQLLTWPSGVISIRPRHTSSEAASGESTSVTMHRKIWVKRPGSSATQVKINEEDLVDDVRDMILHKYTNSLGRSFDPPDVTLRLVHRRRSARHSNHERTLGPEEIMSKVLDVHYSGGQSVEEALIIDVPQKRTPKHSPRLAMPYYMPDNLRPVENGNDYFPPMVMPGPHSPHISSSLSMSNGQPGPRQNQHAISILETGQLPDLPSPGSRLSRSHVYRPKYGRQHTASPTVLAGAAINPNHGKLHWLEYSHATRC